MASTTQKTTPPPSSCCASPSDSASVRLEAATAPSSVVPNAVQDWSDRRLEDQLGEKAAIASLIRPADSLPEPSTNATAKGFHLMICVLILIHAYKSISRLVLVVT